MKKSLIEIYALAVCFVCAAVFTIFVSIGIYSVFEITNPEFTMSSYEYDRHYNNERFLEHKLSTLSKDHDTPYATMSQAELTAARERSFQAALDKERRSGRQSVARALIAVLMLSLMFGIHWVIAKRARRNTALPLTN